MKHRLRGTDAPATKILILTNCLIYLGISWLGPGWDRALAGVFGVSSAGLANGYFWQLGTHQFLHGGQLHLLVNMVALWFAGREVERLVGTGRFLTLYFGGGVVGGLLQCLIAPGSIPLIGASGSVCAVLLCMTALFPNLPITALIFFVIPLRMKAKYLGALLIGVTVLVGISGWMPGVGHWAHLGGFIFGFAFAKWVRWSDHSFDRIEQEFSPEFPATRRWLRHPVARNTPPPLPDIPSEPDFDRVLAKLVRRGLSSLTPAELSILEEARTKRQRW